ncbi:MAG: deoxynucleoside kinase [Myxococcales bacterium]|jgi:deoxyadenosine/deoxycytidine kinase|nr:deoxynucleoside kinase [Myxococcales bacterium]
MSDGAPTMTPRGTWIACVGPIGVGKSTLAAMVARRTGALLVPERFGDNAFLNRFYEPGGIARWGFQTEVAFLTQRVDQVREIEALLAEGRSVVTDFAPQQNLIFAQITVDGLEYQLYDQLYARLFHGLPRPDRLICLDADLRKIMSRIRRRGREMESTIAVEYLRRLRAGYQQWRAAPPAPALWIDTSKLPIPSDLVARANALDAVMLSLEPDVREALFGRTG